MRLRFGIGLPLALLLPGCALEPPAPPPAPTVAEAPAPPPPATIVDRQYGRVKVVGARQVGKAAWYGGRYVGRRTSNGERLDRTRATAAHRSLPLNCLARVTNLKNGKSVVVRVTDRGPISRTLLIDVSPSAADQLDMKTAGLVPVAVEQVVEEPARAK